MSINEIIELLKSNPKIKIKISAYQEWDGYFQLSSDVESESIEHSDLGDAYNGQILTVETDKKGNQIIKFDPEFEERSGWLPNLKKQIYQDYYTEWAEGIIENKSFLEHLNEFVEEDDENGNECDINDFIEYLRESVGQSPDAVTDEFDIIDLEEGFDSPDAGSDLDFSWYFSDYVKDGDIEISGYLNNKLVF